MKEILVSKKGYLAALDPCVGGDAMILGLFQAMEEGIEFQSWLLASTSAFTCSIYTAFHINYYEASLHH
ncbi:MAG: hypothetical protein LBU32_23625 [Clostridiales bacterium]|jgi:hypothetical protein|nr:hypothetical protein [Clostridiales bacterium]